MTAYFADTHPGLKRSHNEDCYQADVELGLWLVADGVGGHADGEVAAAIARDTVQRDLSQGASLMDAIHHAHATILKEIESREPSNMGSTIVALQLLGTQYEIAWVGDSRAYLFNGELQLLSRDHNLASEMVARGVITPEQAAVHPERHILTQSLGVSETIVVTPGRVCGQLTPGQQIILCSDGLSDELTDTEIVAVLRENDKPKSQVESLIEAALKAGGRDNITVVVIGKFAKPSLEETSRQQALNRAAGRHWAEKTEGSIYSYKKRAWILLTTMAVVAVMWLLSVL